MEKDPSRFSLHPHDLTVGLNIKVTVACVARTTALEYPEKTPVFVARPRKKHVVQRSLRTVVKWRWSP